MGETANWTPIFIMGGFLVVMYLFMIRPQKKSEAQLKDIRSKLEIGDEVTTIGGIVGRVVSLKEDFILIETGSDRTKMRLKRWAVQSVEKVELD